MKKRKLKKDDDIIRIYATSHIFKDGGLAEMLYKPEEQKTLFLVLKDGEISEKVDIFLDEYENADGETKTVLLKPFSPFNDIVKRQFVKFPSRGHDYKNELELFNLIKAFIAKYIEIPDDFATLAAVYAMMSWLYDRFQTLPYLRVVGMYGTGKSRFLTTVGSICYKPFIAGGSISQAALYRTINDVNGSFVFDEADFKSSEMWSEIIKILNSGHTKGMPVVRVEPDYNGIFKTKVFHVFGPKILGSRERFTDPALESRCLTQIMFPQENISSPVHLPQSFDAEARGIRNQLLIFRFKYYDAIKADEKTLPAIKNNRLKQGALALTTVADIIDKKVLKEIHQFLKTYEQEIKFDSVLDPKADVVKCILDLLAEKRFEWIRKLKVGDITRKFNSKFYDDYSNRETKEYTTKDGDLVISPAYIISPRKIGSHIRRLNLKLHRDSDGYYIPIPEEFPKIRMLVKRYGFDRSIKIPETLSPPPKQKEKVDGENLNEVPDGFFDDNVEKANDDASENDSIADPSSSETDKTTRNEDDERIV